MFYTNILSTPEQVNEAYRQGFIVKEDYAEYLRINSKNDQIKKSMEGKPLTSVEVYTLDSYMWQKRNTGLKIIWELYLLRGKPAPIQKAKVVEPVAKKITDDELKKAQDTLAGITKDMNKQAQPTKKGMGITKEHVDGAFLIIDKLIEKKSKG